MSMELEKLARRVAALESQLDADEKDDSAEEKEASERRAIAAQIDALESQLDADEKDDSAEEKEASERRAIAKLARRVATLESRLAADDADDADDAADDTDDDGDEKKASLVDPNGAEEGITLDKFTEVEDLEHGTELSDGLPLDVAPTEYKARLKNASSRLDAVATYLERTGRTAMALRIDKVADAIDARVASI